MAGKLQPSGSTQLCDVYNPSTGQVIARVPLSSAEEASAAVHAAAAAAADWAETPAVDRARVLFRYRELLVGEIEQLAALITREHGKTLAESRAEVLRGIELVEFACGGPSLLMGDCLPNIAAEVDAETARCPVGVCVGVTPYNFPLMAPLWMFPIAIVCGNTFVLKPSEKVPLSAMRLSELLEQAGVPGGVLNIVHGDGTAVEALIDHEQVAAVSFVGSSETARRVYQRSAKNGKRVQAAGGAKNHMIVMPDADLDLAATSVVASAFGCTGQRCMAGSVAVAVGRSAEPMVNRLSEHAESLRIGPTDGDETIDVGPLIRPAHVERVAGRLETAVREGGTVVVDGRRNYAGDAFLLGPSVVDHVQPEMQLFQDEVFGPVLSVVRAADLDEALELGRRCPYGNGASIFTDDGRAARQFKRHFNAGMIGVNVGVPAPMAWFPFSGWNRSFFGDLHLQGAESVHFYTRQKTTLTRWFASTGDSPADPVWRTAKQSNDAQSS